MWLWNVRLILLQHHVWFYVTGGRFDSGDELARPRDGDARRDVRDARVVVDLSTQRTLMRYFHPGQNAVSVKCVRAWELNDGAGIYAHG